MRVNSDVSCVSGTPAANPVSAAEESMAVNSFNEWSRLREVIVGSCLRHDASELDLSFRLFHHDSPCSSFWYPYYGRSSRQKGLAKTTPQNGALRRYAEELSEDLEEFAAVLSRIGIRVRRPQTLKVQPSVRTPYWESGCNPALNVRDQAIVFGDEIIETPPQVRSRYFENDLLKPVFYDYFSRGARWTVMPRPVMTDRSFDISYVSDQQRLRMDEVYAQSDSEFDVGCEMMIDAAQCIRFGRDVLVNVANRNHELGFEWLRRHLDGRFRLHRLYRMADNHIDSIVLPLNAGTLLLRHERYLEMLPAPLRKWDVIYAPEPTENMFPQYADDALVLTSKYIDLNVLSLDDRTVVVNSLFPDLIRTLDRRGFTVVPVRHRHRRLFAGGFHCFTLDTVRDGGIENYFDPL